MHSMVFNTAESRTCCKRSVKAIGVLFLVSCDVIKGWLDPRPTKGREARGVEEWSCAPTGRCRPPLSQVLLTSISLATYPTGPAPFKFSQRRLPPPTSQREA